MKTNIYILLILLLSFSVANAQDNNVVVGETENTVKVSDNNEKVTTALDTISVNKKEVKTNTTETKENVARGTSDIRIYLNRVRKVENIKWLFPKINKAKVA